MYAARTGHDWSRLRPRVCDPQGATAGAAPVERAAVPAVPEAVAVPAVPEAAPRHPLEGVIEVREANAPHDTINY